MIFVVLGTQRFQFDRLLKAIDEMVASGRIRDEVFAQIGNSKYSPLYYSYVRFLPKDQFDEYISKCELLITHSGVSTIITGLSAGKPVVVVPRLKKHGEHVDDHQIQIAELFEKMNYIVKCIECDDLEKTMFMAKHNTFSVYKSQRELAVDTIEEYLSEIEKSTSDNR